VRLNWAAVVLTALLLLFVTARSTAAPQPSAGTSAASECTWVRQAKRVVKPGEETIELNNQRGERGKTTALLVE
jgi:hypothetical protein